MKYCIKEFASLLGLTVDTLRLYEKLEIVSPFQDERNRYRYFDDLDARGLLMSRWYRSMGIPLHEAADLMKEGSLEEAAGAIHAAKKQLEEEMRRSARLLKRLDQIDGDLNGLSDRLFRCSIRRSPGVYRLKQTDRNRLLRGDELKQPASRWMDRLPFAFYSFRIAPSELLRAGDSGFDHNWGLALTEEDYKQEGFGHPEEAPESIEYFPPSPCLTSVIAAPDCEVLQRGTLVFMLEKLEQHGIRPKNGALGHLLLTEKIADGRRSYLEVSIPISEEEAQMFENERKADKAHF